MKKLSLLIAVCSMSVAAQAQLIDDFNTTGLSAYTLTPVLYSGGAAPATTTISFSSPAGGLQATAANFSAIEQAFQIAANEGSGVVVERFVPGAQYRVLVVGERAIAASGGTPAEDEEVARAGVEAIGGKTSMK